jgi:hypothetical protein
MLSFTDRKSVFFTFCLNIFWVSIFLNIRLKECQIITLPKQSQPGSTHGQENKTTKSCKSLWQWQRWWLVGWNYKNFYFLFFFGGGYWDLNSGPTSWTILPALFCDGLFEDRVSRTNRLCWFELWSFWSLPPE